MKNILIELLFGFYYAPMQKDKLYFLTHLQEIDFFSYNEIEAISLKEPFEKNQSNDENAT